MKFIFVSGGVISGLGKGITASSIGFLLKSRGIKVTGIKVDPYLNIDAGTMNPYEHGEVYVLDDGGETDLIGRLLSDPVSNEEWMSFRGLSSIGKLSSPYGKESRTVFAKKRYIDPLILGGGRVSDLFPEFGEQARRYVEEPLGYPIGPI